jgi:hypothetical protein
MFIPLSVKITDPVAGIVVVYIGVPFDGTVYKDTVKVAPVGGCVKV